MALTNQLNLLKSVILLIFFSIIGFSKSFGQDTNSKKVMILAFNIQRAEFEMEPQTLSSLRDKFSVQLGKRYKKCNDFSILPDLKTLEDLGVELNDIIENLRDTTFIKLKFNPNNKLSPNIIISTLLKPNVGDGTVSFNFTIIDLNSSNFEPIIKEFKLSQNDFKSPKIRDELIDSLVNKTDFKEDFSGFLKLNDCKEKPIIKIIDEEPPEKDMDEFNNPSPSPSKPFFLKPQYVAGSIGGVIAIGLEIGARSKYGEYERSEGVNNSDYKTANNLHQAAIILGAASLIELTTSLLLDKPWEKDSSQKQGAFNNMRPMFRLKRIDQNYQSNTLLAGIKLNF